MNALSNEIITSLKTIEFDFPVDVRRAFSEKVKIFPLILVEQTGDANLVNSSSGRRVESISFTISIFAKDTATNNGDVIGKMDTCDYVANLVDNKIYDTFGLIRTGMTEVYGSTTSVVCKAMTYAGYIMDGYIYGALPFDYM